MSKKKARGWIPKARTRRIEAAGDYWEPADGAEPLWAEISDDLTFAQIEAIPIGAERTYQELWSAIAPMVTAWNACGRDLITGEYQELPAPADAGPDVFRTVPKRVSVWLARELKFGPAPSAAEKKESSSSDATDAG